VGEHVLDHDRVGPGEREAVTELDVDPPQELGLLDPERGVGVRHGRVEAGRVEPEQRREARPEGLGRGTGRGDRHEVHLVARHRGAPPGQDPGEVLHPPEPRRALLVGTQVLHELAEGLRRAVLDVLLPLRGHLPDQVPRREDDVHLDVGTERGDRARGLGLGRRREQLV
jgi:hypothetical protein